MLGSVGSIEMAVSNSWKVLGASAIQIPQELVSTPEILNVAISHFGL